MEDTNKPFLIRVSDRLTSWVGSPTSIVIHTVFFIGIFALEFFGISLEQILLILTTAVSLEAIYLAIFIQMTVNRHTTSLQGVEEDIEELGEEMEDIGDDLEELGEEVEDIGDDIEEISDDIDKIQEEDAEEEAGVKMDAQVRPEDPASLERIEVALQRLLADIETLKRQKS